MRIPMVLVRNVDLQKDFELFGANLAAVEAGTEQRGG